MSFSDDTTSTSGLFDGRYRIIRRLGSGGMARVFLAEDIDLHREVAIKVLSDRFAEDDEFVERFAREARAAAGLNHQNIVAIYDRGKADGSYYIAMEYLDGETLKDLIVRDGPLPPRRAIDITLQLLAALRFSHKRGIIHRDVKPHNVMVLRDGRVKVTDFGIARAGDSEMTEVGSIVGTAQYLSPEQARGEQVGPEADLYSVGVVLYEMLTGRVPFGGDSAVAIAMKHVNETAKPIRQIDPAIAPDLEHVVQRAMQKDPVRRYRTADEMGLDLDRVRKGLGVATATTAYAADDTYVASGQAGRTIIAAPPAAVSAPAYAERPPPPRRTWPWLVALLLVLAIAMLGVWAFANVGSGGGGSTTTPTDSLPTVTSTTVVNVVGMDVDLATATLTKLGLTVPPPTFINSSKAKGIVLEQSPIEGQDVTPGGEVMLTVSKGPKLVSVPLVVGKDYNTAVTLLTGAGFRVKRTEAPDLSIPAGNVISQDPADGRAAEGSRVVLVVSTGPSASTVPNVVNLSEGAARLALTNALLIPSVKYEPSSTIEQGRVISQDPSPPTTVLPGATVTLTVSSGPASVQVPVVVGSTQTQAIADLKALGLKVKVVPVPVTDPLQDQVVLDSDPAAGSSATAGDVVTLKVGRLGGA